MTLEELIARADALRASDPEGEELPKVVNQINAIRAAEDTSGLASWIKRQEQATEQKLVPIVRPVNGPQRGRPAR